MACSWRSPLQSSTLCAAKHPAEACKAGACSTEDGQEAATSCSMPAEVCMKDTAVSCTHLHAAQQFQCLHSASAPLISILLPQQAGLQNEALCMVQRRLLAWEELQQLLAKHSLPCLSPAAAPCCSLRAKWGSNIDSCGSSAVWCSLYCQHSCDISK